MTGSLTLIAALIAVALIFDFLNGLHDAANSIATVVSTRVLSLPSCSLDCMSRKRSAPASSLRT
jgi:hypothetical protein